MTRRVALINNGSQYAGPALARQYARRGHDLVLAMPADGLVEELEGLGATVEVVPGRIDISEPGHAQQLVDAHAEGSRVHRQHPGRGNVPAGLPPPHRLRVSTGAGGAEPAGELLPGERPAERPQPGRIDLTERHRAFMTWHTLNVKRGS